MPFPSAAVVFLFLWVRRLFAFRLYSFLVSKWCTVTVTDPTGRCHSLDVLAESTYDAAHLFVVEAKQERAAVLPTPTLATLFEVVIGEACLSRRRIGVATLDCRAP